MSTRILLVEDEIALSEPLSFLLSKEGYTVTVADTGTRAVDVFATGDFDLILLDLMLPGIPGTEVCRHIVVGLELGADDYVTKPYSTRELLARIRAVLRRRIDEPQSDAVLASGHIALDVDRHTLHVGGILTPMPLKEFELLEYLMRNEGRVLTRGQLIDRVWGSDYFGDTKTLDVHIKRIRSRIETDPKEPELLVTVRGLGYRFDGPRK
jgi:two-component system response regulator RegX3